MTQVIERERKSLESYLKDGSVAFFGFAENSAPDFVADKRGRTRFFLKHGRVANLSGKPYTTYGSLTELREDRSDVYFLDREATKVLFADFPGSAQYVLVRLVPRLSWLIAIPGLFRRLRHRLVTYQGVTTLRNGGKKQRWLVLRHELVESLNPRLSLSVEVGVQGFLDYLTERKARYVVARFYDKLPLLNREGGDIDILVSDEDDHIVRAFLQDHPGSIGVDVWTVSRANNNGITYFPPPLARRIIESAVTGPAGARIPAPREAFLALAYHVLYHKGAFAGVPSSTPHVRINEKPENDYAGALAKLAADIGINIDITMEALDEYLEHNGWRPKKDTLAKIATRNLWVRKRYFEVSDDVESGLGVFILKKGAMQRDLSGEFIQAIRNFGDFKVLRIKTFTPQEITRVAEQLRGGIWHDGVGSQEDYLPAQVVVVFDTHLARATKMGIFASDRDKRIKSLKKFLRKRFDTDRVSLIHSTDNAHESWEYIAVCFGAEIDEIRKAVDEESAQIRVPHLEMLAAKLRALPMIIAYRLTIVRHRSIDRMARYLMRL